MSGGDLDLLHDELVVKLCRAVGARSLQPKLGASSRLHRAWQSIVEELEIKRALRDACDAKLLANYAALRSLTLSGIQAGDAPLWHFFASAGRSLRQLTHLSVLYCHDTFSTLRALPMGIGHGLVELCLYEEDSALDAAELLGLGVATALRGLTILCREVVASEESHLLDVRTQLRQLSQLKQVELQARVLVDAPELEAFPGCISSITALELRLEAMEEAEEMEGQKSKLATALSGLSQLRSLYTDYILGEDAEVLARLPQLTSLETGHSDDGGLLAALPRLQQLRGFTALWAAVPGESVGPALESLHVHELKQAGGWYGQTLWSWQLQELVIGEHSWDSQLEDRFFEALPTFPRLANLQLYLVNATEGRHQHLAGFLRRQAGTLEQLGITFNGGIGFNEELPAALPCCRVLNLVGRPAVSRLELLAACSMPSLQQLKLISWEMPGPVVVEGPEAAVGRWLRGLKQLQQVTLWVGGEQDVLDAALQKMLPGVEVVRQKKLRAK